MVRSIKVSRKNTNLKKTKNLRKTRNLRKTKNLKKTRNLRKTKNLRKTRNLRGGANNGTQLPLFINKILDFLENKTDSDIHDEFKGHLPPSEKFKFSNFYKTSEIRNLIGEDLLTFFKNNKANLFPQYMTSSDINEKIELMKTGLSCNIKDSDLNNNQEQKITCAEYKKLNNFLDIKIISDDESEKMLILVIKDISEFDFDKQFYLEARKDMN